MQERSLPPAQIGKLEMIQSITGTTLFMTGRMPLTACGISIPANTSDAEQKYEIKASCEIYSDERNQSLVDIFNLTECIKLAQWSGSLEPPNVYSVTIGSQLAQAPWAATRILELRFRNDGYTTHMNKGALLIAQPILGSHRLGNKLASTEEKQNQ